MPRRYTQFEPSLTLLDLRIQNPGMFSCINKSRLKRADPTSTMDITGCDVQMSEICNKPEYAQTNFCACINSTAAQPSCAFAQCTNDPLAYQTTAMQSTVNNNHCATQINCTEVQQMGGIGNVYTKNAQTMACGSNLVQVTKNEIKSIPQAYFVLLFFVVLGIITALIVASKKSKGGGPTLTSQPAPALLAPIPAAPVSLLPSTLPIEPPPLIRESSFVKNMADDDPIFLTPLRK
jgi:hypothetical protein